jgi:DNA-binding NarL/FixJ family response regulator
MTKVLVADDHPVVRHGLLSLLSTASDIEVVATARDGVEAVELAAGYRPDVVLMDLSMPRMNGAEATEAIVAAGAGARVVVLTAFGDREHLDHALAAGACAYVLKDAAPAALLAAVRSAAAQRMLRAPAGNT